MKDEVIILAEKIFGQMKSPLVEGTYPVDEVITIHLKGEVKKFADEVYTPTVSVPLKSTMAILLHLMGFQRDNAILTISKAMKMALEMEKNADEEILKLVKDIDKAMENVESMTSTLPPQTRKGKTTAKGEITILNQLQEAI